MKRILSLGLALLVISASLLSLTACSSSGDEEVEVQTTLAAVYTESAVPVEKSSEEILSYFNSLLNSIKTERPAMYYRFEKNVPNDSLKVTKAGQEEAEEIDSSLSAINDAAKAVKDLMLENIKESSGDIPFGGDNTDVMLVQGESFASELTVDDVNYATMTEVGDKYYITIEFNDIAEAEAKEILSKAFNLRDKESILNSEEFAKTKAYLELKDYSVVYSGCKITATVNRLTNKIETVNYFKAANVTASATGKGTFESHGDLSVLFTLEDKSYYELNWENEDPTSPLETTEVTTEIITEVMTGAIPKVSKTFEQ
ncbi:MAG: hypothetical protein E7556_04445 [Ruminococcaceae bacterium]|nr:hypothetical protein [Oscillospiraceae bacterium]